VKIYTKTGDTGETSLLGGKRVRKNALRIEVCGELDELNACLGHAGAALTGSDLPSSLTAIQRDLLALGAQVADPREERPEAAAKAVVSSETVAGLERAIDRVQATLPPLDGFILPGGSEPGARLHLARAVCRRAERRIVALAERESVSPVLLAYMNRLSDLLFVLARAVNARAGSAEVRW
jgi:cob(I)alamin adenosyltransferase